MRVFFVLVLLSVNIFALSENFLGRYNSNEGFAVGGCEIIDYCKKSKRIFAINGSQKSVDIIDASDFSNLKLIKKVKVTDLSLGSFVAGGINSASVCADSGFVALAVEATVKTDNGKVVVVNSDGDLVTSFDAGALPDMVKFSKSGNYIFCANEGEPSDDYTIDPKGSITIVDMTLKSATQLYFTGLESIVSGNLHRKPNSAFDEDIEPEYISVSSDESKIYVSLQENNAIAVVDVIAKQITNIYGLGLIDHSVVGNEIDASDKDKKINIRRFPVLGMYQPDGIDIVNINGVDYLLTANEGDSRDYSGFSDEIRVSDIKDHIKLNADFYAGYTQTELDNMVLHGLFDDSLLNRLKITSTEGKNGDFYESIYSYGGRSFSVRNTSDLSLVYNSGSSIAKFIATTYPDNFNCSDDNNKFDNRSDDKGCEAETVISGNIDGNIYSFVALERQGGIMVYNINNPVSPVRELYITSRDLTGELSYNTGDAVIDNDLSPEGLCFIPSSDNSSGKNIILAGNEVSGTISAYELFNDVTSIEDVSSNYDEIFKVFPNPFNPIATVHFTLEESSSIKVIVYNVKGEIVKRLSNGFYESGNYALEFNGTELPSGIYFFNLQTEKYSITKKTLLIK